MKMQRCSNRLFEYFCLYNNSKIITYNSNIIRIFANENAPTHPPRGEELGNSSPRGRCPTDREGL